jgi:hypothetical protein
VRIAQYEESLGVVAEIVSVVCGHPYQGRDLLLPANLIGISSSRLLDG